MTLPRGVVTFLFTDVVGSSAMWDRDQAAAERAMRRHDVLLEDAVRSRSGVVLKKLGDGLMAVFEGPQDAVLAAVAAQRAIGAEPWETGVEDFAVRMGLHTGSAEPEGDDYVGQAPNRAARIEAAGHGGQILLSASTWGLVGDAPDGVEARDLGEHYLRGLARPERLYQVVADGLREGFPPLRTESKPDKPSIAVLPFETLGAPERASFADGLVEDLITELSRSHDLFVIARTSSFAYRGSHVDVGTIAAKLGVGYLLEGSVRWAGDQARITAQLIDGSTSGHLWAERYDRHVSDVFSVIDDITTDIVAHLSGYHGVLVLTEKQRSAVQDPGSLGDYERYMRGLELKHRFGPDTNPVARDIFLDVLSRRPSFARAYVALSWTRLFEVWWGWTETPDASLAQAWAAAERAVELDAFDAEVHWLLGELNMAERQYERTEQEYRRAMELNPNMADVRANWGSTANRLGMAHEGVESLNLAIRLNPNHPVWYLWFKGAALYGDGELDEATRALRAAPVHTAVSRLYLAAASQRLGHEDEAKAEIAIAQTELPGITVGLLEQIEAYRDPKDQARLSEPLRAAGLPD